jgi:hypothetical protein
MPVQIDEFEVNVTIQNDSETRGNRSGSSASASSAGGEQMQLMEEALEKIMEVIDHKKER